MNYQRENRLDEISTREFYEKLITSQNILFLSVTSSMTCRKMESTDTYFVNSFALLRIVKIVFVKNFFRNVPILDKI